MSLFLVTNSCQNGISTRFLCLKGEAAFTHYFSRVLLALFKSPGYLIVFFLPCLPFLLRTYIEIMSEVWTTSNEQDSDCETQIAQINKCRWTWFRQLDKHFVPLGKYFDEQIPSWANFTLPLFRSSSQLCSAPFFFLLPAFRANFNQSLYAVNQDGGRFLGNA